ncbi:ATPase [Clostridium cochlearium]|jgi:cell division septum initiation protein DivIVA|uniref:ATPase n=1 Tax=Clostridium cochlearium TaxID=1494 RepID=A0A239ZW14_CLOCO|nr:ATPase [Clostridium cochlearium]MBV1818079.1 hypothetical protein [Bacteroidales bacterium MSK.15.36]NSJ90039.1 ATPase [Coprococcus sp. MSK.21.13]MBE6064282.1 ATPase [Clostridium cochlearium]MBU5268728.1 ATPase [Clostridium cochlearium]MCG4572281.1 ATPase [Clostridium cochlearium]
MDVIKLLEYLQDIIETSSKVPMTGRVVVDKKEVLEVIDKIINELPAEIKKAQCICDRKEKIIEEGERERERLQKESLEIFRERVSEHNVTKEAEIIAKDIISSAEEDAKSIRQGARDYAYDVISSLEKDVLIYREKLMHNIKEEMEGFVHSLENDFKDTTKILQNNLKELEQMNK